MVRRSVAITLFGVLSAWTAASPVHAQDNEANYAKKLEKEFVEATAWHHELAAAKKASAERNLPILAYFTRSYSP